jgi:hypothetical protein
VTAPKTMPAFPSEQIGVHQGITIRDYFAAAALSGLLATQRPPGAVDIHTQIAQAAYRYADAMLDARAEA